MNNELAIEAVRAFFEIDDTNYEYDDENHEFSFRFRIDNCVIRSAEATLLLVTNQNGDFVGVIAIGYTNTAVQAQRKLELEHLLFNMNYYMDRGQWQIAHDEFVYFRYISIEGEDAALTEEMLESCVNGMIGHYEEYLNTIISVNMGTASADAELHRLFDEDTIEDGPGEKNEKKLSGSELDPFILFLHNEESSEEKNE